MSAISRKEMLSMLWSSRKTSAARRALAGFTAVTVLASQLTLVPPAEANSSTASAGSVPPPTVTAIQNFQPDLFTGRATTSIPLAVPPGRKGMQPSLVLAYSSSGRSSMFGTGWNLDLGYIERSTKNGVPKYDATDTYAFMFQGVSSELVDIDGVGGNEYRAKDEALFLRFRLIDGSWEVQDKAGTTYKFGQTSASRIFDGSRVFRWALDSVQDTSGNGMTMAYTADERQLYPAEILYTTHTSSTPAPANRVTFVTEGRDDIDVSYRAGFMVKTAKRVKTVKTEVSINGTWELARRYHLAYHYSPRTGRMMLTAVTQFGKDNVSALPDTAFTYQDTGAVTYALQANNPTSSTVAWNVRRANISLGHETYGCSNPYDGRLPYGAPQVLNVGSANLGCMTATVNSNGSVSLQGCNDHYGHAYTYVYVSQAKTISLPLQTSGDAVACIWRQDANGLQLINNNSNIALQAGWTLLHLTSYHEHQGWGPASMTNGLTSQVDLMAPSQFIKPQLAADVDGNGITDLLKFDPATGKWTVSCAQNCAFPPENVWHNNFGANKTPLVGDWNGDGKADITSFNSGSWEFALSTGTAFTTSGAPSSYSGSSGTPLAGDFNGDGRLDIGTYNNGAWAVALGSGTAFTSAAAFSLSSFGSSSHESITGDFNGDGLTDIGTINSAGNLTVALSNGTAFEVQSSSWAQDFGTGEAHTSADLNGDGLTDVAYYDKNEGEVRYMLSTGIGFLPTTAATMPVAFSLQSAGTTLQIADFNGDGLSDPAVFNPTTGASEVARSEGTFPDLLVTVNNGLGGSSTLAYQASTQCDNMCPIAQVPVLPFVLPLVKQATANDGMGHSYTTTYSYQQGRYDPVSREFRGFAHVEARDAAGTVSITEFSQDDYVKGRPLFTEIRDNNGDLWTKTVQTWETVEPATGSHFVRLKQTDNFTYDGDATFRQTRAAFSYDAYGNPTVVSEYGEVNGSTDLDTTDNRSTVTTYQPNTTAWILGLPTAVLVKDAAEGNGTTLAHRKFYYDNQAWNAAPTQGRLTKESEWLDTATAPNDWLDTSLTYDAYGNVLTVADAEGRTTTNTYDTTSFTYLTQIANALPTPHTRQFAYEVRTGQVISTTDANGQVTTTEYDPLGRVTKVYGPLTSQALPTLLYEYDSCLNTVACTAPIRTTVKTRLEVGGSSTYDVHAFVDGLGRTIQTRAPAQDPTKHIVTGIVEFDSRGRVVKQWLPYLSARQSAYKALTDESGYAGFPFVLSEYDFLGRLTASTAPGSLVTQYAYSDWVTTTTDAEQHVTKRHSDAFGRLARVEEVNGSDTYTTRYQYDKRNNLTKVIDHGTTGSNGNETVMAYDSLGRKTSMTDRDMGLWQYTYDKVDNLKTQTDARGVLATFTYDAINRLTQKAYSNLPASVVATTNVSYTYDQNTNGKGKLTRVVDGSGQTDFAYDALGRLITETKAITGSGTYVVQRSYDLLGRLKELTYPDGDKAVYTYTEQGGINTLQFVVSGGGTQDIVTSSEYDVADRLKTLNLANGVTTTYDYDIVNQRLNTLRTAKGAAVLQEFWYGYDDVGNIENIDDRSPRNNDQSFQYDPLNRLVQATGAYNTVNYQYSPIGNLTNKEGVTLNYPASGATSTRPHAVTSTSDGWTFQYDANGNLIEKRNDAQSIVQTLKYDAENRLVEAGNIRKIFTLTLQPGWNSFSLPVDPDNGTVAALFPTFAQDVAQISRWEPTTGSWSHHVGNAAFDDFTNLDYDQAYQIFIKKASALTVTIQGDIQSAGARTLSAGWHYLAAYHDGAALPIGTWDGALSFTEVRGVDTSGATNAVTQVELGKAYWVEVASTGSWTPPASTPTVTQFTYDGDGGRVKQVDPNGTTTYLGDLAEIAATTTKYIFAGSQRIAAKVGSDYRFYHGDHLGSTNVVTDLTGVLAEYAHYKPFGSLQHQEGTVNSAHKFTGQRLDNSTGLYYYEARYYDPQIGRFTQPDTIVQAPSDPQTLNRYSYVRNNPVQYVDPSGNFFFVFAAIAAIAKAATAAIVAVVGATAAVGSAVVGGVGAVISAAQPALAALNYINFGISAYNAVKTGNVGGFVGGLVGGAVLGSIGQQIGLGMTAAMGEGVLNKGLGGLIGGAIGGAAEFGMGGFGAGFGSALGSGGSFKEALAAGGQGAAFGAALGAGIQGSYMAGWQEALHGFSIESAFQAQGLSLSRGNLPNNSNFSSSLANTASIEQNGSIHPARLTKWGVGINRRIQLNHMEAAGILSANSGIMGVYANVMSDARISATLATGREPLLHGAHGRGADGYYLHFHPMSVDGQKMNSHAWFGSPTGN